MLNRPGRGRWIISLAVTLYLVPTVAYKNSCEEGKRSFVNHSCSSYYPRTAKQSNRRKGYGIS